MIRELTELRVREPETPAGIRTAIPVMTGISRTADAVGVVLESSDRFELAAVCPDTEALIAYLERTPAPAALIDIEPDPEGALARLDAVTRRFSDTRFIVLADSLRNDLVLEAMQGGARHFLTKPSITSELGLVLNRLIPNGSARAEARGRVITVLSASGGCGATTLAVNLGSELHLATSDPALLVDLDESYGGVGAYLGIQGEYGIADVLTHGGDLDHQLIRSTSLVYGEGLRALISPATVGYEAPKTMEYRRLREAIHAFKQAFICTIVDAPRVPISVAADLVSASEQTLLVMQLSVKDVTSAKRLLTALRLRAVPMGRITAVVNRYHKRRSIVALAEAERALAGTPLRCLSNDYRSAAKCLNYGQPLSQAAPRSSLRADLEKLAAEVLEATMQRTHVK